MAGSKDNRPRSPTLHPAATPLLPIHYALLRLLWGYRSGGQGAEIRPYAVRVTGGEVAGVAMEVSLREGKDDEVTSPIDFAQGERGSSWGSSCSRGW